MKIVDCIREFNAAVPFMPYEIHLAGGEKHRVPHPNFIAVSPKGQMVVVIDAKDRPRHLNVVLIERAVPVGTRKHRRRAA